MIRWSARILLALGLALLLAGQLGAASPVLDLANLVAVPVAVACLALLAILFVLATGWKWRAALGLIAIACILVLLPGDDGLRACTAGAPRMKVAWLNTWNVDEPAPILAWLEREQPIAAGFAELSPGSRKLRAALEARYPHMQSCKANDRCATIIYSAVEPLASEPLSAGDTGNRRDLPLARMRLPVPGSEPLNLMVTHFSRPLPLGRQRREMHELELALQRPADTVILGDFNMTPRMRILRDFTRRSGLTLARADRATWPLRREEAEATPLFQIDHVLAGRNWHVESLRASSDLGSDHRGLVAELCRRTPA